MQQSKVLQNEYRRAKVRVLDRKKQWVLAIDFKSAFDMLQREQLIAKMKDGGYDENLLIPIRNLLSKTTVTYDGKKIPTDKGCPQGSCISPDLWAIGMADLCRDLNLIGSRISSKKTEGLCFADDILVFCWDEVQLRKSWALIKKWSAENQIPLNKDKCSLMELRVDNRTPMSLLSPISELKLVTNVKYLGLIFEDSLKMQINLQDKREKEAKLK